MMKVHTKPEEKPKPNEDNNTEDFDLNNFIRKIAYDLYLAGEAPSENKSRNRNEHRGVHTTSNAKNSGFIGTNDYSNTDVNDCNVDDFPGAMKTNSIDIGLKGILQTAQHLAEANEKGTNSTTQNATEEIKDTLVNIFVIEEIQANGARKGHTETSRISMDSLKKLEKLELTW